MIEREYKNDNENELPATNLRRRKKQVGKRRSWKSQ